MIPKGQIDGHQGKEGRIFWNFLADTGAKIKVQIFVLKKDTADIIAAWAQDKAESLGIASLTQTHIEKLSGDNTIWVRELQTNLCTSIYV